MTTYHKRHVQSVEAEKWVIDLPPEAKWPKVVKIYNENELPVSWTFQETVDSNGDLVIDFGLDEMKGVAEYSYETEGDVAVDPVIGSEGGIINVHIHQYNGTGSPK